jgi:hypothetical protein
VSGGIGLTLAYLESMLNVGGNWTALPERGPVNTNEHVNFYAKASELSLGH